MKKKIFSKLLMGAVLVASISSFVSCKDYDDDISNLQSQIDKAALAADVKALDQKLTAAAAAAKEAADKAEADAQKAQSTADNAATKAALEQAIKDINAAAEAAGKQVAADIKKVADDAAAAYAVKATEGVAAQGVSDAAAAKAAADAAQKAADEAAAAAKKAQETADANDASKAYAKQVADEAQAAAVAAADAAVKAANYATQSEVAAAQAAATAAADANADAKIAAALAEIVTKYGLEEQDIKGKLSYIASFQKEFASASALKTQVNGLQSEIDAVKTMGGMAEAVAKIQSYDASVNELYSAVTSVELYYADNWPNDLNGWYTRDLIFTQTIEKANVFPATPIEGEKQFTFKEGKPSVYGDSIVIRVSPINAVVSADMIQLINSKGENLDNLVEVVKVRPYGVSDEELLTRAGANNGLWLVEFNLKEDVTTEDLQKVSTVDFGLPTQNDIRYAVKVCNTEKAKDRGVISAYDLCMDADEARYVWDFTVQPASAANATNVHDIYNRYSRCEDATIRTDKVAEKVWPIAFDELTGYYYSQPSTDAAQGIDRPYETLAPLSFEDPWNDAIAKGFIYRAPILYNAASNSWFADNTLGAVTWNPNTLIDNRQGLQRLTVDVNEDITIEFPANNRIKGFYVTLDNDFALESKPSEIEAWNKYTYDKVGTKTKPAYLFKGNKGTIKVTDEAAKGDVIGFRVYAVHLDGTLYDPDGRAFYISIPGKVTAPVSMIKAGVKPTTVAYYHGDDNAAYVTDFIELDQTVFDNLVNSASPWNFTAWENDANNKDQIGLAGDKVGEETGWSKTYLGEPGIAPYQVYFYDEDKNLLTTNVSWFNRDNIAQAKYIKIRVLYNNFIYYMDGETYKQSIKAQDSRTQIKLAEFSVEFTKTMPKMPVKWTDFQYASQINNGVFNFYPMAPADNYVALCGANWMIDGAGNNVAIPGTAVGIDLNRVFDPKYIDVASFAYTPDDSYNVNAGTDYAEALNLPNTFKMYIDNAEWDPIKEKWVTDEFYFGTVLNNRYDLVKTASPYKDDEFSLISHTLAADAKKFATKITYTYNNVSTRIENGEWVVADDYEVTDAPYAYSTCFVDPFAKPTQSTEKKGSNTYSFATKYAVAPDAAGIELQYFKLTGQYLGTAPYVDNLKNMLANGIWKIDGDVTIIADNGVIYYNITNLGTIATDGAVKISNKFTDESGRPNAKVTQKLTIPMVNILGGKYNFTFSFDMARE